MTGNVKGDVTLKMFFSMDIKNSVKMKLEDPHSYFKMARSLNMLPKQRKNRVELFSAATCSDKLPVVDQFLRDQQGTNIWKYVGDEVIFIKSMGLGEFDFNKISSEDLIEKLIKKSQADHRDTIIDAIYDFAAGIHRHNEEVIGRLTEVRNMGKNAETNDANYPEMQFNLFIKGTVWSCFSVSEDIYSMIPSGYASDVIANLPLPSSKNCENSSVDTPDIIGIGVDYGFRLTQCSDVGRLVIGKHLASIISLEAASTNGRTGVDLECESEERKIYLAHKVEHPSEEKDIYLNFIGNSELKGFSRLQPIYMGLHHNEEAKNEAKHEYIKRYIKNGHLKNDPSCAFCNNPNKFPTEVPLVRIEFNPSSEGNTTPPQSLRKNR